MNSAIVIDYIKKRMSELGHGDDYSLCLKHFVIASGGLVAFEAPNQLLVLIEPVEMVQIQSDNGLYDLSITYSNELQYEHTGNVRMQSYAGDRAIHVRFVQAIPN